MICPPEGEDDESVCWAPAPGGGTRCGLAVDHEDEHRYTLWTPLRQEEASA